MLLSKEKEVTKVPYFSSREREREREREATTPAFLFLHVKKKVLHECILTLFFSYKTGGLLVIQ